jgi:hypothetical protein
VLRLRRRRRQLRRGGPLVGDRLRQGAVVHELHPERAGHLTRHGAPGELRAGAGRLRGHRAQPVRPAATRRAHGVGGARRAVRGHGAAAHRPARRGRQCGAPWRRAPVREAPHVVDKLGDLGGRVR